MCVCTYLLHYSYFFCCLGNVGKVRNNNQVQRVFVSKDGGYSWKVGLYYYLIT